MNHFGMSRSCLGFYYAVCHGVYNFYVFRLCAFGPYCGLYCCFYSYYGFCYGFFCDSACLLRSYRFDVVTSRTATTASYLGL